MHEDKIIFAKDADINKATKIMRQYLEIKKEHPDKRVFFQIGEFYDMFFEDSVVLSSLCECTLTGKVYGKLGYVQMAGVPSASIEIYIKKLIDKGEKVVIAKQFKDKNGDFYRNTVRIYSKGSVYEGEFLDSDKNSYICAISKKGERYGFSYCDTSEGCFYVTEGLKEEIAAEIVKLAPTEILLPSKELLMEFKKVISDKEIITYCPDYYRPSVIDIPEGPYSIGYICANAIVCYLLEMQKDFAPKLDDIEKYSIASSVAMDLNTRRALELTRRQADYKRKGTLFWFLDKTRTPMGRRLLKNWMSAPLSSVEAILKRQCLVKEFLMKPDLRADVEDFLSDFCDLLRLSAKISNTTVSLEELIAVSKNLEKIIKITEISKKIDTSLIEVDFKDIWALLDYANIINKTLESGCAELEFEAIPIKEGANAHLDILRKDYKELKARILELEAQQRNYLGLKAVKACYNANIGYYFEAGVCALKRINSDCIIKQKLSNVIRYATDELLELEEALNSYRFSIGQLEKEIFKNLKEYSKELTPRIREFARVSAYLDAIYSLAVCAGENNLCPVTFNKNGIFDIKDGEHPCVRSVFKNFTPNDTNLNSKGVFIDIITGANMSGKSTYLKQNAVIAVLAQMFGFTSAKEADISPFDKIFFHSNIPDNLSEGNSSFMSEMKNAAYILNNATKHSLILFDEPVKGTKTEDAIALSFGVIEYVKKFIGAKTLFATHFSTLSKIENKFSENICALCIGDKEPNKLTKGISKSSKAYQTALSAGLPKSVINIARKYSL